MEKPRAWLSCLQVLIAALLACCAMHATNAIIATLMSVQTANHGCRRIHFMCRPETQKMKFYGWSAVCPSRRRSEAKRCRRTQTMCRAMRQPRQLHRGGSSRSTRHTRFCGTPGVALTIAEAGDVRRRVGRQHFSAEVGMADLHVCAAWSSTCWAAKRSK